MYGRLLLIAILAILNEVAIQARDLTLSNDSFEASLELQGGCFKGAGFAREGGEVLTASVQLPLFEFCINGELLTSAMPIWCFEGQESRTLNNGGKITSFHFRGKGRYRALHLCWDREIFSEAALIRERLRLRSDDNSLRLTNVAGHNHLIFPRYTLKAAADVNAKELRIGSFRTKRNMEDHHMNHPDSLFYKLGSEPIHTKGPFLILNDTKQTLWTAYEHASQDNGFKSAKTKNQSKGSLNDGQQGTQGDIGEITSDKLWFISTDASLSDGRLVVGNHIRRGGYLDGEIIPTDKWYETVWSVISFESKPESVNEAIGEYLFTRITENPDSRNPDFYYNTWGMQRDYPKDSLYLVMNEQRLLKEIDLAAECGVRTFVIDDGWHVTFGDWRYNRDRFPNSMKPLVERMRQKGITPGIWLSLCGAGKDTRRTKDHPEWIIKDLKGEPVIGQWGNPVYDLVGPFYDVLLDDLKALTDQGFRFFKWDAVNLFNSSLCGLRHGDGTSGEQERIDRYNYLFPFYVTSLMRELREYCPGTVVEIDLTEVERCLPGLMVLQEGKYYFINNGASWYRDYSEKRTRSVRSTINEYAFIMPQELFTYAVYPRDDEGALAYNIVTAIQAGHGLWGNLEATTPEQRGYIASMFANAEAVLPHVRGALVEVNGSVHDTPETYVQRNEDSGYALFTAFGDSRYEGNEYIPMHMSRVLGVVGSPFSTDAEGVVIPVTFSGARPESFGAFVLGNDCQPFRVLSSTGILEGLSAEYGKLTVKAQTPTTLRVLLVSRNETVELNLEAGECRTIE